MYMMFESIVYLVPAPQPVGFGSSIFDAGLLFVPGSILLLLASPLAGAVVNKRGSRLPLVLGSVVLSASFLYFYLLHDTKLQVIVGFMVMGVGMGFMLVSTITIIT
jgi:MFS family permease